MTVSINTQTGKGLLVLDYVGEAVVGLQGNIANPEGVTLLVTNSYYYCIAPATLAATMGVGIAATGVARCFDARRSYPGCGCWYVLDGLASCGYDGRGSYPSSSLVGDFIPDFHNGSSICTSGCW